MLHEMLHQMKEVALLHFLSAQARTLRWVQSATTKQGKFVNEFVYVFGDRMAAADGHVMFSAPTPPQLRNTEQPQWAFRTVTPVGEFTGIESSSANNSLLNQHAHNLSQLNLPAEMQVAAIGINSQLLKRALAMPSPTPNQIILRIFRGTRNGKQVECITLESHAEDKVRHRDENERATRHLALVMGLATEPEDLAPTAMEFVTLPKEQKNEPATESATDGNGLEPDVAG